VRRMLGDPRLCEPGDASEHLGNGTSTLENYYYPLNKETFRNNSCVLKFIAELLSGKQPAPQ